MKSKFGQYCFWCFNQSSEFWSNFSECIVSRIAGILGLLSSPSPDSTLEALTIPTYTHSYMCTHQLTKALTVSFSADLTDGWAPSSWHLWQNWNGERKQKHHKYFSFMERTCHQLVNVPNGDQLSVILYSTTSTIWSFMKYGTCLLKERKNLLEQTTTSSQPGCKSLQSPCDLFTQIEVEEAL